MSRKTRKLIWSAPLVAVFAVVGALAIFVALAPNATQAHDVELPGAVSDLKAVADGTKAVDLSWDAPSDGGTPTSYRIDASGDGQTWTPLVTDTPDASTSYRDEMIVSFLGSDRFYRVFAMNEAGTGPVSRTAGPVSVPDAGAPGNVTGISATADGRKAIVLSWGEPSNTGGTDEITKYLIAGATGADAATAETALNALSVDAIPLTNDTDPATDTVLFATQDATTSYTLGGLSPSRTWYFRVYAYNGEQVSAGHSETRSATTDALGKIGPATEVTAVEDLITGVVTLYWYWPEDDGGRDITHWKVERRQTALSRLDQDTGTAGVQPQVNNEDGVQLNRWQAIADDGESVAVATTNAFDHTIPVADTITVGTETGVVVLVPGASYQYRVTARTGDAADSTEGTASAASNTLKVQGPLTVKTGVVGPPGTTAGPLVTGTACGDYAVPTAVTGQTPAQTRAQNAELARLELACDRSQSRIDNDELSAKRDGKGNVEITGMIGSPDHSTSFRIDVAVVDAAANKWKEAEDYTGNIGNDGEFTFEYEDPTTGGNLEYRVFTSVGQILLPSNTEPQAATQNEVSNPGKVENLKAAAVSQTQIDVTWDAPAKDGDATVNMYCVQSRTNASGDAFDTLATDTPHASDTTSPFNTAEDLCAVATAVGEDDVVFLTDKMSYSHTKLKAGQTRYYKVFAINDPVYGGDERSTSSDEVSATTTKQDAPGIPTGLVAEAAKDSNYGGRANQGVLLQWNKPPNPTGGSVDSYVVQWKADDGDWTVLDSDTGNMQTVYHHERPEPAEGEQRAYRVAAKNGSGTSDWSDTAYYPQMPYEHSHNEGPMAEGEISPVQVTAGMSSEAMDVSGYFSDANMDELTYTATSDMEMYATADIPEGTSMLTITGVAAGSATVTVTAMDPDGESATQTIMVTVVAANVAPRAEGSISPITLMAGDTSDAITLGDYFSDADMDDLTYTQMSSDSTVATAMIEEDDSDPGATVYTLTITGVGAGEAEITVTASDGMDSAEQTIMVTVTEQLSVPSNLRINPVGNGILHVEWDPVTGAAGFYIIAVAPGDATDFGTAVVNNPTATEAAVDGLTPGNDYNVIVVAFGGGRSQVSPISTITAR